MVPSTFTFLIANPTTGSSSSRKPAYIPASTASILISYIGDNPNATPAPGATAPASLPTANTTTLNVTLTSTNPPPAGQCVQVGSGLLCTAALTLPVGVIDMYIQAYSATNGGGTLFASSVTRIQVNTTGTLTAPGTSTAATPAPLSANISAPSAVVSPPSTTLAIAAAAVVPLPTSTASPFVINASAPTVATFSNGQFVISGSQIPTFYGPDGSAIASGNAVSSVVVTDADTSGNTCLIYAAFKSTGQTLSPCSFASAGSTPATITLTNSGDEYFIQYAGKMVPAAGFNVSFSITGSTASSTPKPQVVKITPNVGSLGSVTLGSGTPSGAIVYDSTGKKVYVGSTSLTTPLYSISYSTSTGYGSLTAITPSTVNGNSTTALISGGAQSIVLGNDNNIWFAESGASSQTEYVGVLAANGTIVAAGNGAKAGTTVSSGGTVFGEYLLNGVGAATPVAIGNAGGYIWFVDSLSQAWRINPGTGSVNPNLNTAFSPSTSLVYGATTSLGKPITQVAGTALAANVSSNMVTVGSNLYVATGSNLLKLTLDSSSAPSAGVCTTAGPPPCIATQGSSSISSNTTANAIKTLSTDGTNVYAVDTSGLFYSVAPSTMTITAAAANTATSLGFANGETAVGGLGQGSDSFFWSMIGATPNGAGGIASATSTTTLKATAASPCLPSTTAILTGANGLALGPDNTLLYAPNSNTTTLAACGIVY